MEVIQLQTLDYLGHVDAIRKASRGIVVEDGKILLCHEEKTDFFETPGGLIHDDEQPIDSLKRELKEETGLLVTADEPLVEVDELFKNLKHINYYFMCQVTGKNKRKRSKTEIALNLERVWLPLGEALAIFENFEQYQETDPRKFECYKREAAALYEVMHQLHVINGD